MNPVSLYRETWPTTIAFTAKIQLPVLFKRMSAPPSFLQAATSKQRENFGQLNAVESKRINQAITAATALAHSDSPPDTPWGISDATTMTNAQRNRYSNVFPWNNSRVRLPVQEGASDYINASYVRVASDREPGHVDEYIACQGPLGETTHHFWSMAYHESEKQNNDTVVIVMVTPLIESNIIKCSQYWPDKEHPVLDLTDSVRQDGINISSLVVKYVTEEYNEEGDYRLTTLELRNGNHVKRVLHYFYYKWADAKVPPSIAPLIKLSRDVRTTVASAHSDSSDSDNESDRAPVPIVHCSAGVGRTGTFIAIDHLFHDFDKLIASSSKKKVYDPTSDPVLNAVVQLRASRMMMVQTVYQYNFLYDSARKLFEEGDQSTKSSSVSDSDEKA